MKIKPFKLEQYFAKHEFSAKYARIFLKQIYEYKLLADYQGRQEDDI